MAVLVRLMVCFAALVAAQTAVAARLRPVLTEQGERLYREAGSVRYWSRLSTRTESRADAKAACAALAEKLGRPFRLPTREELLETQARIGFQNFPDVRARGDRFQFVLWSNAKPAPRQALVLRVSKSSEDEPVRVLMKQTSADARASTRCLSTEWRIQPLQASRVKPISK